jgi:hypothetical protein
MTIRDELKEGLISLHPEHPECDCVDQALSKLDELVEKLIGESKLRKVRGGGMSAEIYDNIDMAAQMSVRAEQRKAYRGSK